jgi:hypothetical protein
VQQSIVEEHAGEQPVELAVGDAGGHPEDAPGDGVLVGVEALDGAGVRQRGRAPQQSAETAAEHAAAAA